MSSSQEESTGLHWASSTDVIISRYENKLNGTIAAKTLSAASAGQVPNFTKEEILYLNKKASEDSPLAEIKVITPTPTITLKKGNTEINIKNAVELVKKMEEKYPTNNSSSSNKPVDENEKEIDEILTELEKETEEESKESPIMRDRFKKMVNFPVKNASEEVRKSVAPDVESFQTNKSNIESYQSNNNVLPVAPPDVKTVNKNAYEIRADVLAMSLDWVKFKRDSAASTCFIVTDEEVLITAKKFYQFVENRR